MEPSLAQARDELIRLRQTLRAMGAEVEDVEAVPWHDRHAVLARSARERQRVKALETM